MKDILVSKMENKTNVNENLEFYSVMRSIRAIENSDVCIHVIDATRGFEAQDQRIFHIADRNKKGIIIFHRKTDTKESLPNCFEILDERKYGKSKITFGKFLI